MAPSVRGLEAIVTISSRCGYAISLDEIQEVIPEFEDIRQRFVEDEGLRTNFSVSGDLIVLKGMEDLFLERQEMERRARKLTRLAGYFKDEVVKRIPHVLMLSICGSVSYNKASRTDDIDFFVVARTSRLWLTLLKVLVVARALRLKGILRGTDFPYCFSYAWDDESCRREFSSRCEVFFAREALAAKPIFGENYYMKLMEENSWIGVIFPPLYEKKLKQLGGLGRTTMSNTTPAKGREWNVLRNLAEEVVFFCLGGYLRFGAFLRNLLVKKRGRITDTFSAVISRGSCLYSSKRYEAIKELYGGFEPW